MGHTQTDRLITVAHHSESMAGERKWFLIDEKARDERDSEPAFLGSRGEFKIYIYKTK